MTSEIFDLLGLSERDIGVYRALLALGPSSIRTIAEHAHVNRGSTYECLKGLQQRGIVTYQPRGKRRYFSAREPEVLLQLASDRREQMERAIERLKTSVIPELHHLKPDFSIANVEFYEGDAGIEQVLRDILSRVGEQDDPVYSVFSDRKSTRLNSSHVRISYAVFCLKKKKKKTESVTRKTTKENT